MSDPRLIADLIDLRAARTANRVAMTVPHAVTRVTAVPHAATMAMTVPHDVTTLRPSRPDPSARTGHPVAKIGLPGVTTDPGVTTEARVNPGATAP